VCDQSGELIPGIAAFGLQAPEASGMVGEASVPLDLRHRPPNSELSVCVSA